VCSAKAEPDLGDAMTIFNVQPNCVDNWPYMIVPGGNRLLTSITNGWDNGVLERAGEQLWRIVIAVGYNRSSRHSRVNDVNQQPLLRVRFELRCDAAVHHGESAKRSNALAGVEVVRAMPQCVDIEQFVEHLNRRQKRKLDLSKCAQNNIRSAS
jgi:hypothetical protein